MGDCLSSRNNLAQSWASEGNFVDEKPWLFITEGEKILYPLPWVHIIVLWREAGMQA